VVRESGATATDPLAREQSNGAFRRQESRFRRWVTDDGSTEFAAQAGRYHLYVARACPWAHRTIIARMLMGLQDAIGVSFVDPIRHDDTGWAFTGGEYVDSVNGFDFLARAYTATEPGYDARDGGRQRRPTPLIRARRAYGSGRRPATGFSSGVRQLARSSSTGP
jgi:putative glutathione S-transferase